MDSFKYNLRKKLRQSQIRRIEEQKQQEQKREELAVKQAEVRDYKENVRKEMEKEFMLQNEYRRLKAEDIRQLRERQKRLE